MTLQHGHEYPSFFQAVLWKLIRVWNTFSNGFYGFWEFRIYRYVVVPWVLGPGPWPRWERVRVGFSIYRIHLKSKVFGFPLWLNWTS